LDPGRREFYLAMLVTALVTIGLIVFLVYARIHWPNCWGGHCW
jgi:succinate dehydrogenase hydrophobic anchor subunit